MSETAIEDAGERISPGTRVEVRSRFDESWSQGFEVTSVSQAGYRVRRLSDGDELPADFVDDDVRIERKRRRGTWWY